MRRLAFAVALLLALTGGSAVAALNQFDYTGHVKTDPTSELGFTVDRTASGHKRVTHFTAIVVPISCNDTADTRSTDAFEFDRGMRVRNREFGATGEWVKAGFDPTGSVEGRLKRGGVATGTLRMKGELAGPDTHCHTGPLDWRATKDTGPPD